MPKTISIHLLTELRDFMTETLHSIQKKTEPVIKDLNHLIGDNKEDERVLFTDYLSIERALDGLLPEDFYIQFGKNLQPLPPPVAYLISSMPNNKEKILQVMKYVHLICDAFDISYEEDGLWACLHFTNSSPYESKLKTTVMSNMMGGLKKIEGIQSSQVDEETLRCNQRALEVPTEPEHQYLTPIMKVHLDQLMTKLEKDGTFGSQVEVKIREGLTKGLYTAEVIASELGLSRQSLYRKLKAEATSYSALLDKERLHMAETLLNSSDETLETIAYVLGFTEPSAFYRFFKKHHDVTPGQYRIHNSTKH